MARLGLEFEGHVLVVLGNYFAPEAPGFFGDALSPLLQRQALLVLFLAVPPEPDLPHDALEQLLHVVLHRCRGLDELAVEHDGTGSPLCKNHTVHTWLDGGTGTGRGDQGQAATCGGLGATRESLKPDLGTDKSLIS